jgi:hypothetical protein
MEQSYRSVGPGVLLAANCYSILKQRLRPGKGGSQ